jgi:hypothetical protein
MPWEFLNGEYRNGSLVLAPFDFIYDGKKLLDIKDLESFYSYWSHFRLDNTVSTKTNARFKLYLNKMRLQVCNDYIFPSGSWEDEKNRPKRSYDVPPPGQAADPVRSLEVSKRRAASRVRDIALCNRFDYMFTWTLDASKVDRTSPEAVYKKARSFLTNATQRKGFQYVCIPEYHKKVEANGLPAIHFHGLCSLGDVQIVRSMKGKRPRYDKHGRPVFNMSDWSFGWSTVVPLDENYDKAVSYVTKYITKQETKILGKYYLSSRAIRKAPDIIPVDGGMDFSAFEDSGKLDSGQQFEVNLYKDVVICSEDFPFSASDENIESECS